jgi:hypothetical protein
VIALILGAGLKALKLSKSIVWPEKVDKYFPVLEATNEEPEDIEEVDKEESDNNEIDPDDAELESPQPGWEAPDAWADEDDDQCDTAGIGFTLKKVNHIHLGLAPISYW